MGWAQVVGSFSFSLHLAEGHGLLVLDKLRNLVRSVGVCSTVASNLVHLVVRVRPVALAVFALKLHNLLHDLEHKLVRLSHLVDLQANRAFEVVSLRLGLCELLQARLAGSGCALGTLNDHVHGGDHGADWALEVVWLHHQTTVLIQVLLAKSELLGRFSLFKCFNHIIITN